MTLHPLARPFHTGAWARRCAVPLALPLALVLGGCAVAPSARPPATETAAPKLAPPAAATAPAAAAAVAAPVPAAPEAPAEPPAPPPVATDPLRPDVRIDAEDRAARTDLWERMRSGFAMPELETELVRDSERWYATRPDYVQRMTERGSRYLFHILEEVERRKMPTELALLPFIESAFNPQAMSSAKASGMWQFIPSTGRFFDLKQNVFRDDRRDVLASTRAALDYLQKLHGMFGDWHLALAAYNWGEGSVQRAIARNEKAGLPTDYLSLRMPNETQQYVPKLQAVKNIVRSPQRYGLALPPLENHPYFLSVGIERDIDVALAARFAGMGVEEFKTLNPQMNKPVILAAGTPQVLLPYDNANEFVRRHAAHRGPYATWTAWTAPKTMRTREVAALHGMNEVALRELNRIPPRMLVKAGSTLLVPRGVARTADVSEHVADHATMALAPDLPPMRRIALRAGKRGETVAGIARRYKVSATQVAQWNKTSPQAKFRAGQTIVVFVPQKSGSRVAAAAREAGAKRGGKGAATARVAGRSGKSAKSATRVAGKPAKAKTRVAQQPSRSANSVRAVRY
ncbi:transglycosylase SLT domain-containing protein [Piscinibacter sakaiensis]|uniref:Membrane-bound lytic murein transglycosylase D n=1 Tax=Piscinibacter sakaiensis TaxID=1547922 RepID=A0A0K8NW63_PISS1|nr:transglycosylase SLT domain-containing protein [Piscinibacter sakaiensis]GAP34626.1 membrane-bound lytic murein transglycosylase D precursor [Piscinibacter sakaiensis]